MIRTTRKRSSLRRSRGAALVEAALVLPVMVMFLGMTMFVHRSYADKIDLQATTRSEVLYYGSHNCEGQAPAGISQQSENTDPNGGKSPNTQQLGIKGGTNTNSNFASSSRDMQTKAQKMVFWKQSYQLSRPIHAKSEVACNEAREDNDWMAVINFAGRFARSGGGLKGTNTGD